MTVYERKNGKVVKAKEPNLFWWYFRYFTTMFFKTLTNKNLRESKDFRFKLTDIMRSVEWYGNPESKIFSERMYRLAIETPKRDLNYKSKSGKQWYDEAEEELPRLRFTERDESGEQQ